MLYDSASNQCLPSVPCLYICPVANMQGCSPLILFFIGGNSHPTIPHSLKDNLSLGITSIDTQLDRSNSSRLYEVNIWMWCYGRGSPSPSDSITEAERIRS
jgi:hypothetical protein